MSTKKSADAKIEQSPSTPGDVQKKQKTNRKRKGKLPKNYNAEVPPDPERWLPKYERTVLRKDRDRRAKDRRGKSSQEIFTGAADQYDMSKAQNTPGPSQQHRKGGHNEKKKGRR